MDVRGPKGRERVGKKEMGKAANGKEEREEGGEEDTRHDWESEKVATLLSAHVQKK